MNTKTCNKCGATKPETGDFFRVSFSSRDNKYVMKNACIECTNKGNADWRAKNRDKALASIRAWYSKNRDYELAWKKQYRENNKESISIAKKRWDSEMAEHRRMYAKEYHMRKINSDVQFRINHLSRITIKAALNAKGRGKLVRDAERLLGIGIKEYKRYIESTWKDGMTWENRGDWHIDHIKPVFTFDLTKEEELLACFNYSNTQTLWAGEHKQKTKKDAEDFVQEMAGQWKEALLQQLRDIYKQQKGKP